MSALEKAEEAPALLTKGELAARLGWTRDRLDRAIAADPDNFPISVRGTKTEPWGFDLARVRAYLDDADRKKPAADITPRGRRELASAMKLEDELRASRGETVEAGPLRETLAGALLTWAEHDNTASDTIGSRLGLTPEETMLVREVLDDRRRALAKALEEYLTDAD